MRRLAACMTVMMLLAACALAVQGEPILKPGDRMVFLGDSITQQRVHTRYVMDYVTLRNPGANITFRNAGWNSDTAKGGLWRLERDVLSLKPTVVSICYGMNDGLAMPAAYPGYMRDLVTRLKKAGVRVVLITAGCVDPDRNPNHATYNRTLADIALKVVELGKQENVPVFNIHSLMFDVQTRAKADDPKFTMIPDAVHPSAPGQALMAFGLLTALGYSGEASGLEIDCAASKATTDHCTVRELKINEDAVTFTRTDDALPTYFDPEVASVMKYAPFLETMNAYPLKITGLKEGNWKITAQGCDLGTFSAAELAGGVDLSAKPGPWKKMAEDVNKLSAAQEDLYFTRWRNIQLGGLPSEVKRETDALLSGLDRLIAKRETERIRATAKRTWQWSVAPVR